MTWSEINTKISALVGLKANWDSYGGLPAKQQDIDLAKRWADFLEAVGMSPPTTVTLDSSGAVVLNWESGGEFVLEISALNVTASKTIDGGKDYFFGNLSR